MKKVFYWLVDHWLLVVFFLSAILLWIVTRGRDFPLLDALAAQFEAIRAGARARDMEARLGHERAVTAAHEEHRGAYDALDDEQRKKAEELKDDPVALSRFLVRAGAHRRAGGQG